METHTTEEYYGNSRYCRTKSIQREELERKLLQLHGVIRHEPGNDYVAFIFPSGMSAISTIMQSMSNPNRSIVIGDELYCDSPKVAKYLKEKGFYKSVIPYSELKDTDDIQLIHLETCSNPSGNVPDYGRLMELKMKHNCVICLDNTWLSGASFNPISKYPLLVDIVVESMSKYVSNGQCIGGMCVSKEKYGDSLFSHIRMYGIHVPQTTCETICKTLDTIDERLSKSSKNTLHVIKTVSEYCEITYPKNVECKYAPSIFVLTVPIPCMAIGKSKRMDRMREGIKKLCDKHKIQFETSFGSAYSKIDTFPKMTEDKSKLKIRIYIGYDDDTTKVIEFINELCKTSDKQHNYQ